MSIGVYKITNIITGKFYIGSSKNIEARCANEDDFNSLTKHASKDDYDFSYIDKYCLAK